MGGLLLKFPRNARKLVEWIWFSSAFDGQLLGRKHAGGGRISRTWAASLCLYYGL